MGSFFCDYVGDSLRWCWHAQNTQFSLVNGYVSSRGRPSSESNVDGIAVQLF